MSLLPGMRDRSRVERSTIPRIEGISVPFFLLFFSIFVKKLSMDSVMRILIREIGEVCTKVFQLEIIIPPYLREKR